MSDIPRTRRERASAVSVDAGNASGVIDAAPALWSAPAAPVRRAGSGEFGWSEPRPSLQSTAGPIRPLETSGSILPELEDAPDVRRSLWLHPASLVSIGTTLLALIALGVLLVLGVLAPSGAASALELEVTDNAVRASWSGPDIAYQVLVIDGPAGPELDVSQQVIGTEVWLPRAAGLVDDRSCILVRPADGSDAEVSLLRPVLEAQGAVAGCVADASR